MLLDTYTVAFFGHRRIENVLWMEEQLDKIIRPLLAKKQYVEFLVGRNGDFDQCAASTVNRLQRTCRGDNSALVLVLPYLTKDYVNSQESYESYYDEIEICHKSSVAHPKAAMQIRNQEMVDRADLILCFLENKSGGTYQTIQYALKQGKTVINLAKRTE